MSGGITDDNSRGLAATSGRNTTDLQRRKAALYVCGRARDRDDALHLLEALGLVDAGFHWVTTNPHGPRKKVTE